MKFTEIFGRHLGFWSETQCSLHFKMGQHLIFDKSEHKQSYDMAKTSPFVPLAQGL